jgi:hypothetical protein
MKRAKPRISRRQFLDRGFKGAGALALGSAAGVFSGARVLGAGSETNPFAYNLEAFTRTDPKLVRYEETGRFHFSGAEPRRIASGPEGRLYIAAKGGVSILSQAGESVREIATTSPARCVTVADDGTIYVGLEDHIEVFDAKGGRRAVWDSPGKKTWFSGLALGESELFAADSGNRVVLRYDKSGKVIGRIGEKDKERNIPGIVLPSPYLDVQMGRDGLLRVNNTGRHRVEVYTVSGDLEASWGKPSAAIEGFCGCCNPVGLRMLPDGRHVTCEKGLPRVKIYTAEGKFESVVAGPESFPENWRKCSLADCTVGGLDIAVDAQGRVCILDFVTGDIRWMKSKA